METAPRGSRTLLDDVAEAKDRGERETSKAAPLGSLLGAMLPLLAGCASQALPEPPAVVEVAVPEPARAPRAPLSTRQPPLVIAGPEGPFDPLGPERVSHVRCAREDALRSVESSVSLQLDFENATSGPVRLEWLDFDGRRVRYAELQPGERHRQQTYVTHPWVVVDGAGRCRAIFLPRRAGVHPVVIDGR
jgi:hypothetical protein